MNTVPVSDHGNSMGKSLLLHTTAQARRCYITFPLRPSYYVSTRMYIYKVT